MAIAAGVLQSLVPISQFNKGQAAKIFERLHSEREIIVLKNNQPSAIILSPEEYARLTEIEKNYFLMLQANKGTKDDGNDKTSYNNIKGGGTAQSGQKYGFLSMTETRGKSPLYEVDVIDDRVVGI